MKKDRIMLGAQNSVDGEIDLKNHASKIRVAFFLAFVIVLLASIGFKIYKADHAGISYDEAVNYKMFGRDIHTALHSYPLANNHVLNSIFIYYAHKYFGNYEHFIRIPSVLAGIIFSFALAYIVWRTIQSNVMRVVCLAMLSFEPHIVAYSVLSRGYAFALAGIFMQIAFTLWLLKHKISYRWWVVPILVISLMNFLAFGAMLSSFLLLGAFNMTFILLYSSIVFRNPPNKRNPIVLNLFFIPVVSFIPIFFLYRGVYKQILVCMKTLEANKGWTGWPDFVNYLQFLLIKWGFSPGGIVGWTVFYVFLGLVVVGIAFEAYKFRHVVRVGEGRQYLQRGESEIFIFIVTGLTILFMFVYSVIGNKDLGFPRNQVFLIPLVLLCGVIILDRLGRGLGKEQLSRIMRAVIIILLILATRIPSPYRIAGMTISGPVLRKLKAIDPDKQWKIACSKRMKLQKESLSYYKQFDYKFNIVRGGQHDVMIYRREERPEGVVCLEWDYFNRSKCAIVVNCPLPDDRVILEARLIRD